jgi:hypothetical protein
MSGTHSILAPSAASRWCFCPGSLAACKGIPDEASQDAARGTVKHHMGESCLKNGGQAIQFLGQTLEADGFKFEVDKVFCEQVQTYVDNCRRDVGEQQYEVRLDTSPILGVPGQGGTVDCVTLNVEKRHITIRDAKFGFERVNAKRNLQMMIYLAAAIDLYDVISEWDSATIVIDQPPIHHYDPADVTIREVVDFIEWIRPRAKLTYAMYEGTMPIQLIPGPTQCKYCPIRNKCPARTKAITDMFGETSEEPPIPTLSDEDIAGVLASGVVEFVEGWVKDIRAEAYRRATAGRTLPGFKLVKGKRGARYFTDKEKVRAVLELVLDPDKMFTPRELVSPTKLEELAPEAYAEVRDYVDQPAGSLKLVPADFRETEVKRESVEFGNLY